ncbi:hypothetical protein CC78DRAFT_588260 [Lojkania enalia]|uniref:Uncharacterized protein n=1 Tax=Lojkania enalia TaxID=147567 RepID=A0A9P4N3Z0_9PLEO|nr:hypothetical protein CC78DRAFT_588260 [Didymosphaeria enalia]
MPLSIQCRLCPQPAQLDGERRRSGLLEAKRLALIRQGGQQPAPAPSNARTARTAGMAGETVVDGGREAQIARCDAAGLMSDKEGRFRQPGRRAQALTRPLRHGSAKLPWCRKDSAAHKTRGDDSATPEPLLSAKRQWRRRRTTFSNRALMLT